MSAELSPPPIAPAPPRERVLGYDLARGVAVVGMTFIHVLFTLTYADNYEDNFENIGGSMYDAFVPWERVSLRALDGRAAALFMVLAGIGVMLRVRRLGPEPGAAELARVRRSLRWRGLVLLLAGILNFYIWESDILRVYGVILLVAPWLLGQSLKGLIWSCVAFVGGFLVLFNTLNLHEYWDLSFTNYSGPKTVGGQVRLVFFDSYRSVFPWGVFFCVGIILGRLDLPTARVRWRVLWGGVGLLLLSLGFSLGLKKFFAGGEHPKIHPDTAEYFFGLTSMPPMPLFLLSALAVASVVIPVCLAVAERFPANRLVRALGATGRMALTCYLGHIGILVSATHFLGLDFQSAPFDALLLTVAFLIAMVWCADLWLRRFRQGPLEALLRRLAG